MQRHCEYRMETMILWRCLNSLAVYVTIFCTATVQRCRMFFAVAAFPCRNFSSIICFTSSRWVWCGLPLKFSAHSVLQGSGIVIINSAVSWFDGGCLEKHVREIWGNASAAYSFLVWCHNLPPSLMAICWCIVLYVCWTIDEDFNVVQF